MYKLINPYNVADNWNMVEPFIKDAIVNQDDVVDLDYIRNRAMQGSCQIWVGQNPVTNEIDLVLVSESIHSNGKNVLILRWASGKNMDEWFFDIGLLENWAKEKGFDEIEVWGRRGWERKLRPLGYTHRFTVISRNLNEIGVH